MESEHKLVRKVISIGAVALLLTPNFIHLPNVEAQNCEIPASPKNLRTYPESTANNTNSDPLSDKQSLTRRLLWDPSFNSTSYHVRLTRSGQANSKMPDVIINNWLETSIDPTLPVPLFDPQNYAWWIHAVNECGVSEASGSDFTVATNTPPNKPSPVNH